MELILSDIAFDEDKMTQKRQLMCPGWYVTQTGGNPVITEQSGSS